MPERAHLPSRLSGGPIPGEQAVAEWVPLGLHRGVPDPWSAALAALAQTRARSAHARAILSQGVSDADGLGVRGLGHAAAPGLMLDAPRLRRLRDHTATVLHPSRVADLRTIASMDPGEARTIGRLGYPMRMRAGERGFHLIEWSEAEALAADALATIAPASQAWLAAADLLSNEAAFTTVQAAQAMGVPHLDNTSRFAEGASVAALSSVLGTRAATCGLSDLARADLVLLWGVEAAEQPVLVDLIAAAKDAGTRVVCIDAVADQGWSPRWLPSRPIGSFFGTRLVDDHILVPRGAELALCHALMAQLARWDAWDHASMPSIASSEVQLEPLRAATGLPFPRLEWLAQLIARAGTMVSVWGPGLAQQTRGAATVRSVAHLHLSQGALGRPGCGLIPLRGDAGGQGADDLGLRPSEGGRGAVEQLQAAAAGEVELMVLLGNALADALPAGSAAAALGKVPTRIHLLNHLDATLATPPPEGGQVLLLPIAGPYDEAGGVTFTSVERRVQLSPELPGKPVIGAARAAWRVLPELVAKARPEAAEALSWPTAAAVRRAIAESVADYEGVDELGPQRPWLQWGGPRLSPPEEPTIFLAADPLPAPHDGYRLLLRRGHTTRGGRCWSDRANGLQRDHIGISSADASREGVADGDPLVVTGPGGTLHGRAKVVELAVGHLWVAWPEAGRLVELSLTDEGGSLDLTASLSLHAP